MSYAEVGLGRVGGRVLWGGVEGGGRSIVWMGEKDLKIMFFIQNRCIKMTMRTFEGIEFVAITLKKRLIKHYGEKIKQVVVYGSFARNEATEESGINLPIVIADDLDLYNVRQNLSNLIFDILLENNKLISTIVVVESNFRNSCSEFLSTVKKEGILI